MSDNNKKDPAATEAIGNPHEEVREVIRRGLKFSEELIAENEKLRFKVASLEAGGAVADNNVVETIAELKARVAELEGEKKRLLNSFKEVETLNRDYQTRYAEIEEEHNNLANLYIASYQLHSTLDFREVVQITAEIVINLVGVHRFALYLQDGTSGTLVPVFAEGQSPTELPSIAEGEGPVGEAVASRQVVLKDDKDADVRAVVPLATTDHLVGAIVVHELLVQKDAFNPVDHELFHLLGAHAATALLTALLRDAAGTGADARAIEIETVKRLLSGAAS